MNDIAARRAAIAGERRRRAIGWVALVARQQKHTRFARVRTPGGFTRERIGGIDGGPSVDPAKPMPPWPTERGGLLQTGSWLQSVRARLVAAHSAVGRRRCLPDLR